MKCARNMLIKIQTLDSRQVYKKNTNFDRKLRTSYKTYPPFGIELKKIRFTTKKKDFKNIIKICNTIVVKLYQKSDP